MRAPLMADADAAETKAVVIGDGMVGHWAAQTLAWRGAEVLLVGRHADRLAKFPTNARCRTVNMYEQDWLTVLREQFPTGVQIAVDTVGSTTVVEALMGGMRRYGHIVSAGFYGTADQLALQPLRNGELSLDMVSGWSKERMDATLGLIATGDLQTLPLITHHFPVARAADAWRLIEQKEEPVLGVILEWEH